ncbi:50S ribosomal protein L1 [Metarhizium anisopliae]|nr:50S ribosomal protein L1 [Metarhizium anisopliae]
MTAIDRCLASMARLSIAQVTRPSTTSIPKFLAPAFVQTRQASVVRIKKVKKKRAIPKDFKRHNLEKRQFPQFSLCEAMRVLRAVEVGQPPASIKYEVHINLKTARNGPVVKNSIRLPHPVQSDWQIAVICPEGSDIATAATAAGAVAVGEETLFEAIRKEKIDFDRLICHEASEKALNKAGLGKILGPKGLMPSKRMKTIVSDVTKSIRDSAGAADYRERQGFYVVLVALTASKRPDGLSLGIQHAVYGQIFKYSILSLDASSFRFFQRIAQVQQQSIPASVQPFPQLQDKRMLLIEGLFQQNNLATLLCRRQ